MNNVLASLEEERELVVNRELNHFDEGDLWLFIRWMDRHLAKKAPDVWADSLGAWRMRDAAGIGSEQSRTPLLAMQRAWEALAGVGTPKGTPRTRPAGRVVAAWDAWNLPQAQVDALTPESRLRYVRQLVKEALELYEAS